MASPIPSPAPARRGRLTRLALAGMWAAYDAVRAWPRAGMVAYWMLWALAPVPRFEPDWGWWNLGLVLTWPLVWEVVWEIRERRRWTDDDPPWQQQSDPQTVWGHMSGTRVVPQ